MTAALEHIPVRSLFGVPIHAATMSQVLDLCRQAIISRRRLMIGVVNAAKIVNMRRDALLRESVCGSDLILADGMAVVWAARLLGERLPERVAGIDLFENLLKQADQHRFSIYFLGATQEVLNEVLRRVGAAYPKLIVAGSRNGYFGEAESCTVADNIRRARPDMLFVAMSPPQKELFLARWGPYMDVPVCHGVGGSFDVMAGKVDRAPRIWQRCGLEWLYRVLQEPGRMWKRYLTTNTCFLLLVASEIVFNSCCRFRKRASTQPGGRR